MKKFALTAALGSSLLALAACGDPDTDTIVADETSALDTAGATPAGADWPAGTRIVEEGGVTYRVDPAGARVAIEDGSWSIVTEGDTRYRVSPGGTRVRIDREGLDLEGAASGPDIPGVDVDVGTNTQGNLDVDVSTDGTDASDDQVRDNR
jgi:hypothetical protein